MIRLPTSAYVGAISRSPRAPGLSRNFEVCADAAPDLGRGLTAKDLLVAARNIQKAGARKAAKPSPRTRRTAGRRGAADSGSPIMLLERERDALKEELRQAREEIAQLKQQRDQVVNHIDWVIDSLHNLVEDGH
jgi:hypothetical protein